MESSPFPLDLVETRVGASWLTQLRKSAVEKLATMPLPNSSEEIWRYSRVDDVDLSQYKLAQEAPIDETLKKQLEILRSQIGGVTIVTVDGYLSKELSDPWEETGIEISTMSELADAPTHVAPRDDAFIVANDAFAPGQFVKLPDAQKLDAPHYTFIHAVSAPDSLSFPRTIIKLGSNSYAEVIECFISASVNALTVPVAEIEIGDNSQLHHVVVQNLASSVSSIARQTSRLGRDATLSSANIVFGGDFARVRNDTELIDNGSTSNLSAVYFGENNQMHDFRTLQEHVGKHTKSDLFFRGAVADRAHAVYSGLIRIRKGAHGTDAMQSNRTIKLSPEAVADSVPNLEIDENDVRCAHASAVGPIGEDERYYLESRGVPTAEAERLIVLGFLDQVFARIPLQGVVDYARTILQQKWEAHS